MTLGAITVVAATVWVLNSIELFGTGDPQSVPLANNGSQNGANGSGTSGDTNDNDPNGNSPSPPPKIVERPVQLHFQPQPLRYFKESEITPCWNRVRQGILELEVTRDGEVWYIPAVILDSKGWIATSYSAVVGASSIVARLAPTSPDEPVSRRDLSATITRFVAADPEMDLVMLEVDRRMIELIQPIQLLPRTPVAGTYLVGMGPVFEGWKRWGLETQIASPSESGAEGKFFEHDRPASSPHPGTPLFDTQGRLAGISTAVFANGRHRAIDSGWISNWVAELKTRLAASAATQPFSSLDRSLAIAEYHAPSFSPSVRQPDPAVPGDVGEVPAVVNQAPTGNEPPAKPARNAPLLKLQRQMQQLADTCQKFNFVPTSNEELDSLTEFADALDQARVLLEIPDGETGSLNRDEWRVLDRVNENVMDVALASVGEVDRYRMEDSNKFAMNRNSEGAGGRNTILFADTRINSMTSPKQDGKPTTVFTVLGQDSGIIAVVDLERHVFRDGTRWMLVGRIQGLDSQSVKTRDNETVKCRQFELLLPVGPLR